MGVIPQKLVIGFNNRKETYTGKLGYVCYLKGKNNDTVHQQSLASWADKKIPFEYYDNIPTEGFVLNKKAGGTSWGWNTRMIKARVYDPRGFEFEIDMENLLYILENTNTIKGKALEGEFVYGWMGSGSVSLIPVDSEAYKSHVKNETAIGKAKDQTPLKNNELVAGKIYVTRKEELVLYTGEKLDLDKFINLGEVKDNLNTSKFKEDYRKLKSKTVYKEHDFQGSVEIDNIDFLLINKLDSEHFIFDDIEVSVGEYTEKNWRGDEKYQKLLLDNYLPKDLFNHEIGTEFILDSNYYPESSEDEKIEEYLENKRIKIYVPDLNLFISDRKDFILLSDNYLIKTDFDFNNDYRWKRKGDTIRIENKLESRYFEVFDRKSQLSEYNYNKKFLPSDLKLKIVKEIIIK